MIEIIDDMPEGTIGFRSKGALTGDDYRDVLVPPLRAKVEAGEKIRMLFVVSPGFKETPSGLWEDMKTGASLGSGHLKAWERTAIVTDEEWAVKAVKAFGWLAPGKVKSFPTDELAEAKVWIRRTVPIT